MTSEHKQNMGCIKFEKEKYSKIFLFRQKMYLNSYDEYRFLAFPACFWTPIFFSNFNCFNLLGMKKLFWPFTIGINCSTYLKNFVNSWPSASNLKSFSWSLKQFFLSLCQKNVGNKIPFLVLSTFEIDTTKVPYFFDCFWTKPPKVAIVQALGP